MKHALLRIISSCGVDLVAGSSSIAWAGKIDYTMPDCLGRLSRYFADAAIIFVSESHAKSSKRKRLSEALPRSVHTRVVLCNVKEFRDASTS